MCVFVEEPGAVYGILGNPLYIPCVTDVDFKYAIWSIMNGFQTIGDSSYGIYSPFNESYELATSPTSLRNSTLKIKRVRFDEPSFRCEVVVEHTNGTTSFFTSSLSNISVIGELDTSCIQNC